MKNIKLTINILILSLGLISISSCSNTNEGETNSNTTSNKLSKEKISQININNETFIKEDLNNFFKGEKYKVCKLGENINISTGNTHKESVAVTQPIFGPFNYTLYDEGTIQSNTQLILSNIPQYAYGVYYCDLGRYSAHVSLPNNTTGWINPNTFTNQCYLNYNNQTLGYAYNISVAANGTTTLNVATYYLKVNYNILAQWLGGYKYPSITATPTIKYSYMNI